MKRPTLYLWVALLCVALLCAQGVRLHVHSFGQEHDHVINQQHDYDHTVAEAKAKHAHLSKIHLTTDISHIDHHDEVLSELDVNPEGFLNKSFLNKISNDNLLLAVLVTLFALLLIGFYRQRLSRYQDKNMIFLKQYLFFPPLRAPPPPL